MKVDNSSMHDLKNMIMKAIEDLKDALNKYFEAIEKGNGERDETNRT